MLILYALIGARLALQGHSSPKPVVLIHVEQDSQGCFHHEHAAREWIAEGDHARCGEQVLSRADVDAIRRTILGARHEVPELLMEAGITPESVAAHREQILATATPATYKSQARDPPPLPAELEPLLQWETIAPRIRERLVGGRGGTESVHVRVTLVGNPDVIVDSEELVPWMLPWTVRSGGTSFTSEDLSIPRTLLPLLDPSGPCVGEVDGRQYWPDRFWSDQMFWDDYLGGELDRVFSGREYTKLPGWERVAPRIAVRQVMTGFINRPPESMFFDLDSKEPAVLDGARWHNFLVDGKPSLTWNDFLALYESAATTVARQKWLLNWKRASPGRTLNLDAAGKQGFTETQLDFFVVPPWRDAGFSGSPQFEILLRENGNWVGTVWLSETEPRALILTAHFSHLSFSFHPRGDPPTYARVDPDGKVALRTMKKLER